MAEHGNEAPIVENGSNPQRNELRSEQKLLDLLGSEIERADARASRSGVTRWTLIASMGGLLWLLSHQLESSRFIWAEVGTAFLALIVLSTLYTEIGSVLLSSSLQRFPIQTGRVLIVNSLLGASRLDMAFSAVRDLILVLVSVMLVLAYNRNGVMALTFVYGLACLVNVLTIILSYVPWPIPLTNTKKYWLNAKIIVLGLMIVTSIGGVSLALPIISPEGRISMTALRIGGLLFVVTMLLDWIVRNEGSDRWPIDTLVAIRHAYHSGQLDLANAWDQCDVVFTGTTVSRVFQADLECILRLQREIADRFNQIDQEYERVEKMFVASPDSPHAGTSNNAKTVAQS